MPDLASEFAAGRPVSLADEFASGRPVGTSADSIGALRQSEDVAPVEGPAAGPVTRRAQANLATSGGAEKIGRGTQDIYQTFARGSSIGQEYHAAGEAIRALPAEAAEPETPVESVAGALMPGGAPIARAGRLANTVMGAGFTPIHAPLKYAADQALAGMGVPEGKAREFASESAAQAGMVGLIHGANAEIPSVRKPSPARPGGPMSGILAPRDIAEGPRPPEVVPARGQLLPGRADVAEAANAPPPRNVPRDANVEVPEQAPPEPARGGILDPYGRDARQELQAEQLREIEARARARGIDVGNPPPPIPITPAGELERAGESPRTKRGLGPYVGPEEPPPAEPRPQGLLPPRRIITPPPGEASSSMERPPGVDAAGRFRRTLLPGELRGGRRSAPTRPPETPQEARPPGEGQESIFGQEVPPPPKEPTEEPLPEQLPEEPEFQTEEGPVVRPVSEEERLALAGNHEQALPEVAIEPTAEELAAYDREMTRDTQGRVRGRVRKPGEPVQRSGKDWSQGSQRPEAFNGPIGGRPISKAERRVMNRPLTREEVFGKGKSGLVGPSGEKLDLSPQASEAQRALEERDAAVRDADEAQQASLKAEFESRPKGPTEQSAGLFGRTDLGRKLDQRDLPMDGEAAPTEGFDPEVQKRLDAEEAAFEAERQRAKGAKDEFPSAATEKAIQKAPFSEKMGLAIKRLTSNKKATEGAQQFYDEKLAKKNQGSIWNPFKWGERHGQNQTMKAAPEIAEQARKAANSSAAAQYRVAVAYDRIGTEVGPEWQQRFADTMSESQQRGQKVKYGDLRDQFARADPADVPDLYKDHGVEALVDLDERRPGGADAVTKMYAKFEKATLDITKERIGKQMQDFLVRAFDSAASDVTTILPDAEYQANLKAPEFARALDIAKTEFLDDLANAHSRNAGKTLSPAHLGEVGTYWPMTGKAASDMAKRQVGGGSRGPFVKPLNPLNKKRTGLSDAYDTSWEAVARKASAGFRADEHAHLLNLAESRGILTKLPPGQGASATYDFDGVTYVGAGDGTYAMPKWFRDEMGPILDKPPRSVVPESLGSEFSRGVLATNTAALVDKTFHYINAVGTQAAFNPALGSRASQVASHLLPGFKTAQSMVKLFRSVGPEEGQMVRDMLDNGEWYPRFDENTGVLTSMSKRDLATRLDMRKGILETRPEATANELYEASTRFGEYNKLLETEKVRLFKEKHNMVAPFVTAGTTMRGNAVQSLKMGLGTTGGVRSALQGGLPMALGSWIGVHALVTKIREGTARIPDPTSDDFKFGGVPIGETDDGRTMFLNVMRAAAPMANRGFSATGVKAFAETLSRSDEDESADVRIGQAVAAMTQDLANASVHPFIGPAPKVLTRAAAGIDPQVEKRGGNWQFRNAHEPTMPGMETYRANLRSARDAMNPLLEKTLPGMTRGENAEPEPYSYLDKNRQPRSEPLFGESAGADENAGIPAWAIPLRWLGLLQVENIEGHKAGLRREPRNVAKEKRSFQKREFRKEGP